MFKAGARVVKNVTGYDLPKLMTGSYGTLAALTSITLKVLPKPETEETIVLEGLDDAQAVAAMSLAMQSSCEVSGAAHIPGEGTYLRLEGIAPSVAYRRDQLAKALGRPVQVLAARSSMAKWQAIRDATMFADDLTRPVWRLSVTPSDAPGIIATLRAQTRSALLFRLGRRPRLARCCRLRTMPAAAMIRSAMRVGPCHAVPGAGSGARRRRCVPAAGARHWRHSRRG